MTRSLLIFLLLICSGHLSSCHDRDIIAVDIVTSSKNENATTPVPTPAVTSAHPTVKPKVNTHEPTKKYVPPNDDENTENEDNGSGKTNSRKHSKILWTLSIAVIAVFPIIYFRNSLTFFCGNAIANTQRYGCKGLLRSFFPCFYRGLSIDHQPLDQIIFETDEGSYTRSNLREGLM